MTWKGITPAVHLVTKTYRKGVKVFGEELEQLKKHWNRSTKLPKWDITVNPL